MNKELKQLPKNWRMLVDEEAISKSIARISFEIAEKCEDPERLAIVGIKTGGEYIARRIHSEIQRIEGRELPFGVIDISLYRDDHIDVGDQPTLMGTDLPFRISGSKIILVDDVFFTGRTIRAALDAIIDFGRPAAVQLAVLADRGHQELPIRPDYVGRDIKTARRDFVRVVLKEMNYNKDGIFLLDKKKDGRQ